MKKLYLSAMAVGLFMPFTLLAQNWGTAGNTGSSGLWLGTNNAFPLTVKTNNTERFSISATGVYRFNVLSGTGNGLLLLGSDGTAARLGFPGTATQVLTGAGTFAGIGSLAGWGVPATGITATNNKVGIGLSAPANALEVLGNGVFSGYVAAQQFLVADMATVQGRLSLTNNMYVDGYDPVAGTRNEVYTTTQPYFVQSAMGYNNNTIINYNNTGMVGIGTESPVAKLHVEGDFKVTGEASFSAFNIANTLKIRSMEGTPKWLIYGVVRPGPDLDPVLPACIAPTVPVINAFEGIIHSYGESAYGGTVNSMTMGFDGANGIIDVAGISSAPNTPKLLLNYFCGKDVAICTGINGGIVSIGRNLEIGFPLRDTAVALNLAASNKTGFSVLTNHTADGAYNTLLTVNRANTKAFIVRNNAETGAFGAEVFQVFGNGNTYISGKLGVGTNCIPEDYKMGVDGYIICEGVNVKLANGSGCWPDYVFEKNYNLMSLREIEAYIDRYKHLPGMPSAKEVEEKGIDLAETNRLLTQKLEELTLLLIKMEKEMEAIKAEINK